jgi:hypothetical protein
VRNSKGTVVWVLVSVVLAVTALGVAVLGFGLDERTSPVIITVFAMFSALLPSVLALLKVDQVHQDVANGHLSERVTEATEKAIENKGVLTREGPVVAAQLATIQALLEKHNQGKDGIPDG